jgi:hypothetical protein
VFAKRTKTAFDHFFPSTRREQRFLGADGACHGEPGWHRPSEFECDGTSAEGAAHARNDGFPAVKIQTDGCPSRRSLEIELRAYGAKTETVSHYVKFTYERAPADIAPFDTLTELNACRRKLLQLRLIGVDSSGMGFGNLSVRAGATRNFYITGSATGGLPKLSLTDCVRVVAYDFPRNWLSYEGAAIPSSESLTHAAIYESDSSTSAVIHSHDLDLWATLLDSAPTTSKSVAYGTPAMAYEIIRLFKETDVRSRKIFVMAGHEGGIVTFGENLGDAFDVVMRKLRNHRLAFENGFNERIPSRYDG